MDITASPTPRVGPASKTRSMTDFHTHILPGMDDGSRDVAMSLSMLRELARQGITLAVMTPHFYAGENSPRRFLERRERAWQQLRDCLEPGLPEIRLGAEVQFFEGICNAEDVSSLRIQGTNFLLLEMPFCKWTSRMLGEALELNDREDVQVVLAHIDRYLSMQPKEVWSRLRDRGVRMQANVSFFASWRTRRSAISMLADGRIHLLGSDCHNLEARRPNWDTLPDKAWRLAQKSGVDEPFGERGLKLHVH